MAKKLQFGFDFVAGSLKELAEKPNGEKIVSYLSDFKGQRYFSIRSLYTTINGPWMPGKQGLTVPASMMDDLIANISKLNAEPSKGQQCPSPFPLGNERTSQ